MKAIHDRAHSVIYVVKWLMKQLPVIHLPQLMTVSPQQHYLRSEEDGKEEVTLQLLLNVSAQCDVCFPCTPPLEHLLTAPSIPSMHTINDDTLSEVYSELKENTYIYIYIFLFK